MATCLPVPGTQPAGLPRSSLALPPWSELILVGCAVSFHLLLLPPGPSSTYNAESHPSSSLRASAIKPIRCSPVLEEHNLCPTSGMCRIHYSSSVWGRILSRPFCCLCDQALDASRLLFSTYSIQESAPHPSARQMMPVLQF